MKLYNRRNYINGAMILGVYLIVLSLFYNQGSAKARYSQATTVANETQTAIALITENAPTHTPGPSPTASPIPTGTSSPIPITATLVPPCEQILNRQVTFFAEPSTARTIGKIDVDSGQTIYLFGKLLDEPWWYASRKPDLPEGWLQDMEVTIQCDRVEKKISQWLSQVEILYETFRGIYIWQGGLTEIKPSQELSFRYSNSTNNFAEYESLLRVKKVNFQIRTSFRTPDRERIKELGLSPKESFIAIRLKDTKENSTEFKLYLDCRYSSGDPNRPVLMKDNCENKTEYFILLTLEQDTITGYLNNETIQPFKTPPDFDPRTISISLGAYPEALFRYVFVISTP